MAKDSHRELATVAENRDAALEIAKLARRQLCIFTHDFEPQLYDTPEFIETVRQLALSGSRAGIRVLLMDNSRSRKEGHRLVTLSRQLSSYIEIRKPHRDYMNLSEAFAIADERGLLYRKLATRWEGFVDLDDPFQARDKLKLFEQIWQRSQADPETRRIRI